MSGKNVNMMALGYGMKANDTQYATGLAWHKGSQVRWNNGILEPIGGWTEFKVAGGNSIPVGTKAIRDIFSWRAGSKVPHVAFGSTDNVHVCKIQNDPADNVYVDATPVDLSWTAEPNAGFGSGFFGAGYFGLTPAPVVNPDVEGQWTFDSFGRNLIAVHNQDGRLFEWDPSVGGAMTVVANAPTDNTICITTEEEFVMVMGGVQNPVNVSWCSRRDITDWTATESNSAGGFDISSDGAIVSAHRVQGGILVFTNKDVHLIEYVGPPNYYSRRLISDIGGIVSKNAVTEIPGAIMWAGSDSFWKYDGNITRMPCDIQNHIFDNIRTDLPSRIFMGNNEEFSEVWFFYPSANATEPGIYAIYNFGEKPCWYFGQMERTAWHAPVFSNKPISASLRVPYNQETGWTDAGTTRVGSVWLESGAIELAEGDKNMRIDRIYQDFSSRTDTNFTGNELSFTFKIRQAPKATERTVGPITPNIAKGYTTTRFRARQAVFRIDGLTNGFWGLGKVRLRAKEAGAR